jgi:hypothetical protein
MTATLDHLFAVYPKGICFAAHDGQNQRPRQLKARRYRNQGSVLPYLNLFDIRPSTWKVLNQ